jgi:hypothetical protein
LASQARESQLMAMTSPSVSDGRSSLAVTCAVVESGVEVVEKKQNRYLPARDDEGQLLVSGETSSGLGEKAKDGAGWRDR